MDLKRQELLILYKLIAQPGHSWSYAALADALRMSVGEVHNSVKRAVTCGLAVSHGRGHWEPVRPALLEFSLHGIRYAFPAEKGPPARGVPTSIGVAPLANEISAAQGDIPVWPHPEGTMRGPTLSPLYKTAADAALIDTVLHEYLALLDALRSGRARERALAEKLLKARLS